MPNGTATMITSAVAARISGGGHLGARGDDADEQVECGLTRRTCDEHAVPGCHEEAGEGCAHLARA
ncbi:hypothetical protein ACFFRL_00170 [Agromyces hippuratus]|uniref:hypothetical protein n=1 Tax=Agromyces hippuratus TaxID=286438 RepID=UPI0035EB1ECC